jgi:DnaJ like chaperone protein
LRRKVFIVRWFGKAIGAALGMALGSYPGAALGALLGHQFDQGLGDALPGSTPRAQNEFFAATFEVMGHIAKIDGRVSEGEIQVARRIMHAMRLDPDQVRRAISHFTTGKRSDFSLQQRLSDLVSRIGHRPELSRAFIEIQVEAAVGAGDLAQSKREVLWQIARKLGIDRVELAQIESMLRARQQRPAASTRELDLGAAYRTLGVEPKATDKEIKTAYRRMMNLHHPDKLVSKGLPESMRTAAEERTQQILAAYERIKDERRIK